MKKLDLNNKKTRNALYKAALEHYLSIPEEYRFGLCYSLCNGALFLLKERYLNMHESFTTFAYYFPLPHYTMKSYPEIYEQMPRNYDKENSAYWFPLSEVQKRIDILEKAIKLTE